MRHLGPSMNTGAKGVLNEFAAHQEQAKRIKEAKDREVLRMARKGMLQGSKAEREQVCRLYPFNNCPTPEESLIEWFLRDSINHFENLTLWIL